MTFLVTVLNRHINEKFLIFLSFDYEHNAFLNAMSRGLTMANIRKKKRDIFIKKIIL